MSSSMVVETWNNDFFLVGFLVQKILGIVGSQIETKKIFVFGWNSF